jgi:hypothetical protein
LVLKIYRQNRLQFANLLANLVRNFITNFDNLMRNFRIWLAGFQSTWWSRVYSSQIPNQPRNWCGQSFVKSTVTSLQNPLSCFVAMKFLQFVLLFLRFCFTKTYGSLLILFISSYLKSEKPGVQFGVTFCLFT